MRINGPMTKLLSCLMTILLPAAMVMADAPPVTLSATGPVVVNGKDTSAFTAIFSGDKLQTLESSTARIVTRGSMVELGARSSVVYGNNSVNIDSGTALVNTSAGMSVRTHQMTVAPMTKQGDRVKFLVTRREGETKIAALTGNVTVSYGENTLLLRAGEAMTRTDGSEESSAPPVVHFLSEDAGLIIVLAAALAAGLIYVAVTRKAASPSHP